METIKNMKYEAAVKELETIVDDMESGQLNLDELTEKLKRAQMLLKLCKDRLTKTEDEIQKILKDDKQ